MRRGARNHLEILRKLRPLNRARVLYLMSCEEGDWARVRANPPRCKRFLRDADVPKLQPLGAEGQWRRSLLLALHEAALNLVRPQEILTDLGHWQGHSSGRSAQVEAFDSGGGYSAEAGIKSGDGYCGRDGLYSLSR